MWIWQKLLKEVCEQLEFEEQGTKAPELTQALSPDPTVLSASPPHPAEPGPSAILSLLFSHGCRRLIPSIQMLLNWAQTQTSLFQPRHHDLITDVVACNSLVSFFRFKSELKLT